MAENKAPWSKQELFVYLRKILFRQISVSCLICLVAGYLGYAPLYSWVVGCIASLLDVILVLRGVYKGFGLEPALAARLVHKTLIARIITATAIVLCMLKMKYNVTGVFISFILLHIALILDLTIIAGRNKNGECRKE